MKELFRFSLIALLFAGLVTLSACEQEDDLEPNPDAAGIQALGFNPFDTTGSGGGGGTGGGGNPVNQYFDATIDGVAVSYDQYTYMDNGLAVNFSGLSSSSANAISFALFGAPTTGATIALGGFTDNGTYVRGVGDALTSKNGQLVIDTAGSNFIRGTFFFTAENVNNPSDTVVITNGAFQIEI